MFIDLHMHRTESDGTDSPEQIIKKITAESGIKIFALTDHDTISGIEKIKQILPNKIFFINGVEFSCKISDDKKCHILAYFFDGTNDEFQKILEKGCELRKKQLDLRLNYLSKIHNINFSDEDIKAICTSTVVGKPHIANFVAEKYGIDKDKIYKDLRKCYVGDARQDAEIVIKAIKESGGIAIWAHPLGGEGEPLLPQVEFENRLQELISIGLQGLECYYSRYTNEQEQFLFKTAQANNLLISGGSDYHGTNKTISLGTLSAEFPKIKIHQLTILQKIFENHADSRIRKAFEISKSLHLGQFDKAGVDYIYHPMTVALSCGGNISAMIVALLHDVVEDTHFTFEDLQKEISLTDEESQALKLLTHDKSVPYFDYIRKIKTDKLAIQVKIADLEHNSDSSRIPAEVISEKDLRRIEKYKHALKILKGVD